MAPDKAIWAEYDATRDPQDTGVFCHAPFVSLNFEQNGNVTACCYNREAVLGTYPEDSIHDIWHGDAVDSFRKRMADGSPPPGCEVCVNQLENRNFQGLKARFYDGLTDSGTARGSDGPKVMEFEISNTCNLECVMCDGYFSSSIRKNREKRPALASPYNDEFVHQLVPFIPHLREARFLGGEPFLIRVYQKIWELIAALNPEVAVSITTNGTVLTDRMKNQLEGLRAHIILSLDSLDEATYEAIRVNARFSEVMKNLSFFENYVERAGTKITIAICPMQQNWRELPDFVEFCNERGFLLYCNTVLTPQHSTLRDLSSKALDEGLDTIRGTAIRGGTALAERNLRTFRDQINQLEDYRDKSRMWEDVQREVEAESAGPLGRLADGDWANRFPVETRELALSVLSAIVVAFVQEKHLRRSCGGNVSDNYFVSMPRAYFANLADQAQIGEGIQELSRHCPAYDGFVSAYFDVLTIAASVLNLDPTATPSGRVETMATKLDRLAELVAQHPDRDRIVADTRRGGTSIVLWHLHENPMADVERLLSHRYPKA